MTFTTYLLTLCVSGAVILCSAEIFGALIS